MEGAILNTYRLSGFYEVLSTTALIGSLISSLIFIFLFKDLTQFTEDDNTISEYRELSYFETGQILGYVFGSFSLLTIFGSIVAIRTFPSMDLYVENFPFASFLAIVAAIGFVLFWTIIVKCASYVRKPKYPLLIWLVYIGMIPNFFLGVMFFGLVQTYRNGGHVFLGYHF